MPILAPESDQIHGSSAFMRGSRDLVPVLNQ
jgi:hypothetical protein